MSMDAYRWALSWGGLKANEKFILILIADYYNDGAHRAWPSIERLAKTACMNRTTVMRAIKGLHEQGLLEVEPWVRADTGGALTNRYCLPLYDPGSVRAERIPVVAYAEFDHTGKLRYDTFPHKLEHGEEIPSYAA